MRSAGGQACRDADRRRARSAPPARARGRGLLAIFTARAAPAADRFAETSGSRRSKSRLRLPCPAAWTALAGLGSDAELGLAIGRPTLERAVGDALAAAAIEARPLEGATLTLGGHRLLAGPQSMRLVLEGKLDGGYFAAGLVATAIPRAGGR